MGPSHIPHGGCLQLCPSLSNCNVLKENELSNKGTFSLFTLSNPIKSAIKFRIQRAYSVQSAVTNAFVAPGAKDKR